MPYILCEWQELIVKFLQQGKTIGPYRVFYSLSFM